MQIFSKAYCYNNLKKKNKKKKLVAVLSKFIILCLPYSVVYFLKSKLILFYNRVVYYYTRLFQILL